jgi:hypothetical protein
MSTSLAEAAPQAIAEILLGLPAQIHDGAFYFADGIPAKKLHNATATFAHLQPEERALVLVDTTVFGSAKEGAVLTDRRLYAKLGKDSKDIPWAEVKFAACVDGGNLVWLTVNGGKCLQGGAPNTAAITILAKAIRDIAILSHPRINDFTPPEECTVPDPGKAPGLLTVSWHQEKKPIPPGTGWFKRLLWPLQPVYEGPRHREVQITRIVPAIPEIELPHGFGPVFAGELKEGFLLSGYAVATTLDAHPDRTELVEGRMAVEIEILEYTNPGFLQASLDPFHGCVFRFKASFFEHGASTPFAHCFVAKNASRYGLMSIALHVVSVVGKGMGKLMREAALDLGKSCKAQGL